jgi:carbon storage regulator
MLILSRKINEKVMIGDDISVSVIEIRGDQVRLGVTAPRNVKVFRREIFDAIKTENEAAAESTPVFPELDLGLRGEPL